MTRFNLPADAVIEYCNKKITEFNNKPVYLEYTKYDVIEIYKGIIEYINEGEK
jgi:hypothetical protein